jgi:hypothetical protein
MQSTKSHWYPLTMEALGSAATILQLVSFTGEVLVLGYGYLSSTAERGTECGCDGGLDENLEES